MLEKMRLSLIEINFDWNQEKESKIIEKKRSIYERSNFERSKSERSKFERILKTLIQKKNVTFS